MPTRSCRDALSRELANPVHDPLTGLCYRNACAAEEAGVVRWEPGCAYQPPVYTAAYELAIPTVYRETWLPWYDHRRGRRQRRAFDPRRGAPGPLRTRPFDANRKAPGPARMGGGIQRTFPSAGPATLYDSSIRRAPSAPSASMPSYPSNYRSASFAPSHPGQAMMPMTIARTSMAPSSPGQAAPAPMSIATTGMSRPTGTLKGLGEAGDYIRWGMMFASVAAAVAVFYRTTRR